MIRNVIFDWSGTLVNDLPAVLDATNYVLDRAGKPTMTLEEFRSAFCLPFAVFYDRHIPHVPLAQLEQWFHGRFEEMQKSASSLPHAEAFLRFCRERNLRMFVLSTVSRRYFKVQAKLTGFGDYMHRAYLDVRDKREKIAEILHDNQLHPEETLFVGDMEHDIETAKHGGIHSCAVLTGYNTLDQLRRAEPDLIVEHLGELQNVLEENELHLHLPSKEFVERHGPIATVGALIFNQRDEVLMVRTHKWSNLWGIPGGKIKWGEASRAALEREIREETGLDVTDVHFELVQDCIHSKEFYREAHFVLLNYTCRVSADAKVTINEEAQEFLWVTIPQAQAMELNHPTRVLLDHVVARRQDESMADTASEVFY